MNVLHPTDPPQESTQDDALVLAAKKLAELEKLDPAESPELAREVADELAAALDDVDEI